MNNNQESLTEDRFIDKPQKEIHYFWIGYILTTVGYTLMIINNTPDKLLILLQFAGIGILVPSAVKLIRYKFESRYLAGMFAFYLFWSVIIIARGFQLDKDYLMYLFLDSTGGLFLYLSPLIILFPLNLINFKKISNVAIILGACFLIFSFMFMGELLDSESENGQRILEYFARYLSITCGFILLLSAYQSNRRNLFSLFVIGLTFFFAIVRARRGLIFMSSSILVFSFIFYFYANKGNLVKRFLPVLLLPFALIYGINAYQANSSGTFSFINERIDEDSRSGVEKLFFMDMTIQDWIIGKGISGEYAYAGIDENNTTNRRGVIETDYLQIILKGGIISLGILLLIAVPAIIKGLFYSNNTLSKVAGLWILFWMVDLYPTTVTNFALNYLIVWICIGICYSHQIRNLPDELIKEFFQNNQVKYFL